MWMVLVAAYLTNVPMNSTAIGLIVDGIDGTFGLREYILARNHIYFL